MNPPHPLWMGFFPARFRPLLHRIHCDMPTGGVTMDQKPDLNRLVQLAQTDAGQQLLAI